MNRDDVVTATRDLRVTVDVTSLSGLLMALVQRIEAQDALIVSLRQESDARDAAHCAEVSRLRNELDAKLGYAMNHVASAMDAVRHETQTSCQRALPDIQAIPAIQDRLRRLEAAMESQVAYNTQRNLDQVELQRHVESLQQSASRPRTRLPADIDSVHPLFDQVRRDVDDLLAVLDIPNAFSSLSQRSITTASLRHAATLPPDQRVKFVHSLPCFHSIWRELFRLQEKFSRGDTGDENPRGAFPVKSPGSHVREAPQLFIATLEADVAPAPSRRGLVVVRTVRGGVCDDHGVVEGDTILELDRVPIAGSFHLQDMCEELEARNAQSCTLTLIPSGRSASVPVDIRLPVGRGRADKSHR